MGKFRKKPIVIEAVQYHFTQESNREIIEWTRGSKTPASLDTEVRNCSDKYPEGFDYPVLGIATLEGMMNVRDGDWVIQGVNGEFYPCKPNIFEKTYEKVEE